MPEKQFTIRDARGEDIPQLTVLITQLGYPCTVEEVQIRFNLVTANADYRWIVVTDRDQPIAMAGLMKGIWVEKNGLYVRILAFVVEEAYRDKGIGKILIEAVEDWAASVGANSIIVNSGNRDERIGAHAFYQKRGYELKSSGFIKQL